MSLYCIDVSEKINFAGIIAEHAPFKMILFCGYITGYPRWQGKFLSSKF